MPAAVTLKEIERVFEILADFDLSREAVVIPLTPAAPGRVRLLPDHRIEIVFDSTMSVDAWLLEVRQRIAEIVASPAGVRLRRAEPV
jgi:hypothetical protein